MKTVIGSFPSIGIEVASLPIAKAKDGNNGQFTVSFMEMLSSGETQPLNQEGKAAPSGMEGQVKSSADSIVESEGERNTGPFGKVMLAQGPASAPASAVQKDSSSVSEIPTPDAIGKSGTPISPGSRAALQNDSLPFPPVPVESKGDHATQSSEPVAQSKGEKQSACVEKSDVNIRKSRDAIKTAKEAPGKEQQNNASNVILMVPPNAESAADRLQASVVTSSAPERLLQNLSDLSNQGNLGVALPDDLSQTTVKGTVAMMSPKSLNSRETKASSKQTPVSNPTQEETEFRAGKERVESSGRLNSQSNDAVTGRESANTASNVFAIAHRPEQTELPSSPTMQTHVTSTGPHHGSDAADSVAPKQTPAPSAATSTATNDQPHILKATANTLEVGLSGGPHGWVKVRAEMASDGRVNASLSSSSSTGQQMLRHELPSLTTFLKSENVQLGSLSIQPAPSTGERSSSQGSGSQSPDQGSQSSGSDQTGEQRAGNRSDLAAKSFGPTLSEGDIAAEWMGNDGTYPTGGSWLSVIA